MLEFLDFIKRFDFHHIISMIAVFWFMTNAIRKDISELKNDIKNIDQKIISLDTRLSILESKASDINTNINHMMWYSQSLHHRDVKEE